MAIEIKFELEMLKNRNMNIIKADDQYIQYIYIYILCRLRQWEPHNVYKGDEHRHGKISNAKETETVQGEGEWFAIRNYDRTMREHQFGEN